jgi:hypothetical protein
MRGANPPHPQCYALKGGELNPQVIKTPSTMTVSRMSDSKTFLDFNKYCWDYLLSESFIRETFEKYESMPIEKPEGVTPFKDYILDNIDIINRIKDISSRKLYEPYI